MSISTKERFELEVWIALNVTGRARRLTDDEYKILVDYCEEANREPHPNLSLTQPCRYEGVFPNCTEESSSAMEVLKKCHERLAFGITTQATPNGWNVRTAANTSVTADGETLEMAICIFAKKLFSK